MFTQAMYDDHMKAHAVGFQVRGYVTGKHVRKDEVNIFNLRCVVFIGTKIPAAFYWYPTQYTEQNLPKNVFFFGMIERQLNTNTQTKEPVWGGWAAVADLRLVSQPEFDAVVQTRVHHNGKVYTDDFIQDYSQRYLSSLLPRAEEEWLSFEERPA
jgi:hypothetical protein